MSLKNKIDFIYYGVRIVTNQEFITSGSDTNFSVLRYSYINYGYFTDLLMIKSDAVWLEISRSFNKN